ncbi:hypothetical protein JHK85_048809 [Glycine max]|nr:hypothetical protein JHK85_048809 [Glycine max]
MKLNSLVPAFGFCYFDVGFWLDVYIHDYLVKRDLKASAQAFQAEGKVSSDPVAIDAPGGFLFEWWSVFWDIFIARTNEKHSEVAASYIEQRFGDQILDPNHASILKSSAATGQPSGQVLHGAAGAMSPQVQARSQQLPGSTPDIKSEINPVLNPRAAGPEGSLIAMPGILSSCPYSNGLEQLRSGLLQQQKPPFIQSPQQFHQLPMLTPQHQQQLMLAQQNLASPSASDDSRRIRMLLNNRNMGVTKDGLSNPVGDIVSNVGSPLQAGGPAFPRSDTDMLMKLKLAQLQHQQQQNANPPQQQLQQHTLSNQQSQTSNHSMHQQDKMGGGGGSSVNVDGSMSNSFRGNDQVSKNQTGRKRKQPASSGPANSSGTANTAGPSPSSAPSTPSTHTPGDVMSMPVLPHSGSSSKPLMMFSADGAGTLTSPSNQLWDDKDLELQADVDRFVEDGSLDDNVESFLSPDDTDLRDTVGRCMDVSKGFTFSEINSVRASTTKVGCCHFSSDGKLLASGGHDKKAVLWFTDSLKQKATLEEHASLITDVRFSPSMPRLATSSHDKTVRVWDVENPGYSLRTFTGHSSPVMSLDFHPNKDDLICSCDADGEIRYWSINNGNCARVSKGGAVQMRFQPRLGRYLAAAAENVVSILDVETQASRYSLKGVKGSVFTSLAVMATSFTHVFSIQHILRCWSLVVTRQVYSLELWNMTENKTMTLSAHEGLIAALAVSTVNGLVASASHDKFVKLWK